MTSDYLNGPNMQILCYKICKSVKNIVVGVEQVRFVYFTDQNKTKI